MITDALHNEHLLASLEDTTAHLLRMMQKFGPEKINRIAFENSWTAAQVADHITKSNNSIVKALLLKGVAINRDPGLRVKELRDVFLNFNSKMKSPDFILPAQDIYDRETVIANLEWSVKKIKEVSEYADLLEMINHTAFGDITKFEILHFVLYHTQRHIHQLEKIFEALSNR